MKADQHNIINRLSFRVLVPVLVIMLGSGSGLYFLVNNAITELIDTSVAQMIAAKTEDAYSICDLNFNEMLRNGGDTDQGVARVRKGLTLGLLEEFVERNDMHLVIKENDRILIWPEGINKDLVTTLIDEKEKTGIITQSSTGTTNYFSSFHFEPWQWHVILLHEPELFAPLFDKARLLYSLFFLVSIASLLVLIYVLTKVVRDPIKQIIKPLDMGEKPTYRGIAEFQYMSESLNTALATAEEKTVELKRAYESLERKKDQLVSAQKIAGLGYWDWNAISGEVLWTDEVFDIFGRDRETFIPSFEKIVDATAPESREAFEAAVRNALETREYYEFDYPIIRPDNTRRTIYAIGKVYRNEAGEAVRIAGTVQDITERKEIELALQRAKDELEKQVRERTRELKQAYVQLKQEMEERERQEKSRLEMEIQAMSQAKLASLGEIATGMAHEVNQPLTYIRVVFDSSLRDIKEGIFKLEKFSDMSQEALRQIERITLLIDHLRTFGREAGEELSAIGLGKVVDNSLILMGEKIKGAGIELDLDIPDGLPDISGNANKLEQVFINLFQNALDILPAEMNGIGRISLAITRQEGKISIRFTDNGPGVEPQIQDRIFEPFFTTKAIGKGTGLGLAIAYGIITEHQGSIACQSIPGQGTTFHISLPIID